MLPDLRQADESVLGEQCDCGRALDACIANHGVLRSSVILVCGIICLESVENT